MGERPYTPERLAERWECHVSTVKKMLETGELGGFKLGKKLWRVSAGEVERFECQTTGSESSKDDGAPSGMERTEEDIAGDLMHRLRLRQERSSENFPENVTRLQDHHQDSQ